MTFLFTTSLQTSLLWHSQGHVGSNILLLYPSTIFWESPGQSVQSSKVGSTTLSSLAFLNSCQAIFVHCIIGIYNSVLRIVRILDWLDRTVRDMTYLHTQSKVYWDDQFGLFCTGLSVWCQPPCFARPPDWPEHDTTFLCTQSNLETTTPFLHHWLAWD